MFKFNINTNIIFGAGEAEKLGSEIKNLGFSPAAVIIDKNLAGHPQTRKALESVKDSGVTFDTYISDIAEPDYDYLDSFKAQFTGKEYECVVGIGGGSILDLSKAMATLLRNPGPAIQYRGFPQLANRPLPVIALPTTAGTGSEVTYNAVFTDSHQKKKLGINSKFNFPVLAIIDPLFTVNCPKGVTVSSGADALVHTLESFVHKNHTPVSRMYSEEAFRLLFNSLGKVLNDPANIEIRANLALGAYLAGIALINAGSGPAGAFSYPLGAVYKVPHGYAGAIFISAITKLNVDKGYQDYSRLYDLIEGTDKNLAVDRKNIEFSRRLQELMDKLGVPKSLSSYKLGPDDMQFMISQYEILKAAIDQNPLEVSKEDARQILMELA